MQHTVQLLKWDHSRFTTLLNYLQGITRNPEPGSCNVTELLELYALLKPGICGRHQAEEAVIWQRLREQGDASPAHLQRLQLIQLQLVEQARRLEQQIRSTRKEGTLSGTELGAAAQPFIDSFRELIEFEEQHLFPLLKNRPVQTSHDDTLSPSRHGIDCNYLVRPQE